MKNLFKTLLLAAGLVFAVFSPTWAAEKNLTVVELFTSQGCSSCQPADAFLGDLAKRDDLLALSIHVDYWDYIGWKDPFGSPENTKRQRRYARTLGMRYVYTPQMVVQGASHVTGSDRVKVAALIEKAARMPRVPISISRDKNNINIKVSGGAPGEKATVWLAVFDNKHDTPVKRGENGGRTLSHYNVVRNMSRIGTWTGRAITIPTDVTDMRARGRDGCAVILQSLSTGRILGAAKIVL
ncbi:MAG: DUF1223 domain-containing protein [Proteobacteria bacterium]|nr:DUF1223 domain-containing protein [Pseudomonadota bacterium]MDA1024112.1 DUF1223 domain-containing protein [Pseudomonadota bacterium]